MQNYLLSNSEFVHIRKCQHLPLNCETFNTTEKNNINDNIENMLGIHWYFRLCNQQCKWFLYLEFRMLLLLRISEISWYSLQSSQLSPVVSVGQIICHFCLVQTLNLSICLFGMIFPCYMTETITNLTYW